MFLGQYTPSQWSAPAMVSITVPNTNSLVGGTQNSAVPGGYVVSFNNTGTTTYIFDAVMELEHEQRLTRTRHPVQTGADISSHAYLEPAELILYVGMSDSMSSYATGGKTATPFATPFSGNPSKSVAAYQQMIKLQEARTPLTITTRLRTYTNMLIDSVSPRETHRTIAGLRMRVAFGQIRTGVIGSAPNSARPNDTENTGLGVVNTKPPSTTILRQFNIKNYVGASPIYLANVPGAGQWSSVNTSSLQQLSKLWTK